jgi:peptidoglycan/LPS O-acetylase OafA/YrhL
VNDTASHTAFPMPAFIPQFDGLRGLSILAVFVSHSEFVKAFPHAQVLEYGRVGVDLFFVLSGFLITGILLDSRGSLHYFRNFYMRRSLRIWPLYYLFLTIMFASISSLAKAPEAQEAHTWLPFYFYVQNLFPHLTIPFGLEPTWSLAIEEQFYMTWPLLVVLLKKRTLAVVLICLVFLSLALRLIGFQHDASPKFGHNFTFCRLDAIAFGSLAAIWLRSVGCTKSRWRRQALLFVVVGLVGIILARIVFHQQSTLISYTFIAMGFAGVLGIALISDADTSLVGRFLSLSWLRYTGRISYGLYLLHMPLFLLVGAFVRNHWPPTHYSLLINILGASAQFLIAFVMAAVSWLFLESPILRLKAHFPSGSGMHWPNPRNSL